MQSAYLTAAQVATELDISTSGVYKLVNRGKLPAIRLSERGLRVPRVALDAYKRRLQSKGASTPPTVVSTTTLEESRVAFEQEAKLSPAEWERRWKADEIEDSAENMGLAIRALSLLLREQDATGHPDDQADRLVHRPAA